MNFVEPTSPIDPRNNWYLILFQMNLAWTQICSSNHDEGGSEGTPCSNRLAARHISLPDTRAHASCACGTGPTRTLVHAPLVSPLSQGQLRLSLTGVGTSHCPLLIPLRGIIPSSLLQAAVRRPAKQFSFAGQFSLQLLMVLVSAMLHAAASTSKYSVFF